MKKATIILAALLIAILVVSLASPGWSYYWQKRKDLGTSYQKNSMAFDQAGNAQVVSQQKTHYQVNITQPGGVTR